MRVTLAIAAICLLCCASNASAEMVRIDFDGLLLSYSADEELLFDSNQQDGGGGDPAQSTPLTFLEVFVDGNSVGTQSTNIAADVTAGVSNIPATGGQVFASSGIFDILIKNQITGWGLALNVGDYLLTYDANTGEIIGVGTGNSIHSQDLSTFGIAFDDTQPITVNFVTTIDPNSLVIENGNVVAFNSVGSGSITGTAVPIGATVPEPTSLVLFGMGGVALLAARRRRKTAIKSEDVA